ncbi:GIY-YIG nuclease family protein [Anaeromassilibacillus senegalensis]|uniref:GIY-YIG nuclease family protein n=1 Tax=Anaeromassilibacillus senegalensis TaxID=1673717 RepID=UPI00068121E4|nr:GIY-YIG nuclease family protein [Anaeromassilibacillus senegalensis]
MNFVYILQCADGSFYTGWTTNLQNRLRIHCIGKGAKYTRARLPVKLIYWETAENRSEALRREAQIKRLTHAQKEQLVKSKKRITPPLESVGKNMVY